MIRLVRALRGLLVAMLIWGAGSFISLEPDFTEWDVAGRIVAVLVWLGIIFLWQWEEK